MESYKRDFVLLLARNNCILRDKTLKSGRISPIYFNFGGDLYTGKNMGLLAEYYAHALQRSFVIDDRTGLFGPAYKGIPLATATAMAYARLYGHDIRFAFDRKSEKDHGEGGLLCGKLTTGDKIITLDDVFTTGETKKGVNELLITAVPGITIAGVLIGIDRKEMNKDGFNAVELFSHDTGILVDSVVTIDEALVVLEEAKYLTPDWKEDILKDRAEHGC
ncbi:orotate phosphoribosyltransferase [Candidatus Woesearchaeota archaeon]|nr:orotate phosphoribosyltransferase [Candidatus Woesearchaeota archaeon]